MAVVCSQHDRHRGLTIIAAAGLALAAALAVFGLPPVDLHGPLHHLGIMAPTCGATRAVHYAARGDWETSWRYNPLGIILIVGATALMARSVIGSVTDRWLNVRLRRPGWVVALSVIAVVGLEVNQQLHAALLMSPGLVHVDPQRLRQRVVPRLPPWTVPHQERTKAAPGPETRAQVLTGQLERRDVTRRSVP